MFDLNDEMSTFCDFHVSLSKTEKDQLADYRDKNIRRLKSGLNALGFNTPIRTPTQGGYSMRTMTQWPESNPEVDRDIDTAVIFRREDLPESALNARKQVLAGIVEGGGNFKSDPEARTNAVTVWYQDGYHVDLAVHRTYTNDFGQTVVEHAGADWSRRDPLEITTWFNNLVDVKSPSAVSNGANVKSGQMRRVVQLLKYFSKSRRSWSLPGGLLISVLVSECYCPDGQRDDRALYWTMESIRNRLQGNLRVFNPVDLSQELTYKDEYVNQVGRLNDKLGEAIRWLSPLVDPDCDRSDAVQAWFSVFNHSYWKGIADKIQAAKARGESLSAARVAGSLYADNSGQLFTSKPEGKSVAVPDHRFYGTDN